MPIDPSVPLVSLPPGWTADYGRADAKLLTLCYRSEYFVTLNFWKRCYALGVSDPHYAFDRQTGDFTGKGWRDRFVLEAMGYLVSAVR